MNLRLSPQASQRVLKGAPFIGAQDQLSFRIIPPAGTLLRAQSASGDFLAHVISEGPRQAVAFRVLTRERHPDFGPAWWQAQVAAALEKRVTAGVGIPCRLVNAEADGLPGMTCDLWAPGVAALTVESTAALPQLETVAAALQAQAKLSSLWRRLPAEKGAEPLTPWQRSDSTAQAPARLTAQEGPARLELDFEAGQVPPMERRAWRLWLSGQAAGQRVLVWGEAPWETRAALTAGAAHIESVRTDGFKQLEALAEKGERFAALMAVLPVEAKYPWGRFIFNKQGERIVALLKALALPQAGMFLAGLPQEGQAHPGLDLKAGGLAWTALAPTADLPPLGPGFSASPPAWTAQSDPA